MGIIKPPKIKEKLTIVIPCYNEDMYIKKTIDSIYKQIYIEGTRIIIADNNSTDRTRGIINNLKLMYSDRLKIEMVDGGNVSTGRNLGSDIVNTEYILFLDADIKLFESIVISDTLDEMIMSKLDLLTCQL